MNVRFKSTDNKNFYYNNLFFDYIFNFEKLRSFFVYDYRDIKFFENRINYLRNTYDSSLRELLCQLLFEYNKEIGASDETFNNIELLQNKDTFIVIAGQQPAIFTGPIFNIYKITTVIKLASYLSEKLNIKVVPMFWVASDDNDISEVKSVNVFSSNTKISLDIPEYLKTFCYSKIILPIDEYENLIRKLLEALPPSDYKSEIISFFNKSLFFIKNNQNLKGCSLSRFFSIIISRLFKGKGLVLIDPEINLVKKLSKPIIDFDIKKHKEIHGIVNFSGAELISLGYHSQLKLIDDNLDFFINTKNGREKIKFKDESLFMTEKTLHSKKNNAMDEDKIRDFAFKNITDLSLNVVLRPILQDFILPNIATISGPGEISYFAQIRDIYTLFGIEMPIIYPRLSATIVENKILNTLRKIGINYKDLLGNPDIQAKSILKNSIGFDISQFIKDIELDIEEIIKKYKLILKVNNIEGEDAFNRINQNLKKEVDILGKRILSECKRKNGFIVNSINKIYNNILPGGCLQERYINIFEYINKYNFKIIDAIFDNFKVFNFTHKFIEIG